MTLEQALQEITLLSETGHGKKSKAAEYAVWLGRMVSGEDHEEWLDNIRPLETDEEKKTRRHVYRSMTKSVIQPIQAFCRKIYRTDGRIFHIEHKDEVSKGNIYMALAEFHGGQTAYQYLADNQIDAEFNDPNGYLLIGKSTSVDETGNVDSVTTFPIEIPSSEIAKKEIVNGLTKWLIRRQSFKEPSGLVLSVYTVYAAGMVVVARQIGESGPKFDEGATDQFAQQLGREKYAISYFADTGSIEFPGAPWGAYYSRSRSMYVAPLDPASDLLNEAVKGKSIFDICMDKHVFPRRYEFQTTCEYKDPASGAICNDGYLGFDIDGEKPIECPKCAGTGKNRPRSENNVVSVELPPFDHANEIFKLADLYHYESVDLKTVEMMYQRLQDIRVEVPLAVFSSQMENQAATATTATEINYQGEVINNRVYPLAEKCSRLMELIGRVTAQYMGYYDAKISHSFPENLKLETLSELINRLKSAKDAGANAETIFAIQCEIAEKTNAGSQQLIQRMKTFERLKPWRSLDPAQAMAIYQMRANNDTDRVLYENWDKVKEIVTQKYPAFFNMDYDEQLNILNDVAAELSQNIIYATMEAPEIPSFV